MSGVEVAPREATARLRYLRVSPTKVRQVVGLINGKDIGEARDRLRLCERSVAREVAKALDSAIANAEHNANLPEDELYVSRAFVDEGPTLKRWRPRARGRGVRIRKRTSHLTIAVARFDDDELLRRRSAETAAGGGSTRRRPTRRRAKPPAVEHDHEHEHEHDAEDEGTEAPAKKSTAKKTTKKTAKKATAEKAPAEKASVKKSTAKKATAKKTTAKKATPTKKAPAKKRAPKTDE
jgi:large subunit ribosomal protein L22